MITLFTAPKPFLDPHICTIQRNALDAWRHLHPAIEVFVVGDEEGIQKAAREFGHKGIGVIKRNQLGTPLLNDIFQSVRERASYDVLCYANADILFLDDLLPAAERLEERFDNFLAVGQRWDMDIRERLDLSDDWSDRLRERILDKGRLHPPMGSDYFLFPKDLFQDMPPFALGRAGWDNWMIFAGRHAGFPVVDATHAITIIHQNHDYHHLPDGKPHYRLPESDENVRLAGGREAMFTLEDANWMMTESNLRRFALAERDVSRVLERGFIAHVGAGRMAQWIRKAFHPVDTFHYYWKAIKQRLRRGRAGARDA